MAALARSYRAALDFAAPDENGALFPADERFRAELLPRGLDAVLSEASRLDEREIADAAVVAAVRAVGGP